MSQSTSSQLSRVKIEGFKSIKKCDLELRGINVLIGSNGSGKSNFISTFTLLQNILTGSLALYVGRSGMNSLFYNGIKTTDNILMEFYFDRNSYSFELVPTDSNGVVFKEERFGYHGRWNYTETTAGGHQESTWRDGNHNEIDKVVVPLVGAQEIIPVLNRQWRVYHFHDTGKNSKMKAEHNLSNNQALLPDASNLAAFLRRLRENYASAYRDVLEAVRLIAPYFQDFELEPNEGNGEHIVLRWRQRGCEDVFNASQLSDGTLRFICLATLLLQPAKLQPATIIVDEPELGLHPYAITIFAEMVKRASAEKQIILSTQSVYMYVDSPDYYDNYKMATIKSLLLFPRRGDKIRSAERKLRYSIIIGGM